MKMILTVKTGKGDKSTSKDVDKTVDLLVEACQILNKKFNGFKEGRCKIYSDGTSMILER